MSERDENGRWLPGTSGNLSGRPNDVRFKEKLKRAFPADFIVNMLYSKVAGIDSNISDRKLAEKMITNDRFKKKFKKFSKEFTKRNKILVEENENINVKDLDVKVLSEKEQIRILEFVVERLYGKAPQVNYNENHNHDEDNEIQIKFIESEEPTEEDGN